jgi:hypothetical protein
VASKGLTSLDSVSYFCFLYSSIRVSGLHKNRSPRWNQSPTSVFSTQVFVFQAFTITNRLAGVSHLFLSSLLKYSCFRPSQEGLTSLESVSYFWLSTQVFVFQAFTRTTHLAGVSDLFLASLFKYSSFRPSQEPLTSLESVTYYCLLYSSIPVSGLYNNQSSRWSQPPISVYSTQVFVFQAFTRTHFAGVSQLLLSLCPSIRVSDLHKKDSLRWSQSATSVSLLKDSCFRQYSCSLYSKNVDTGRLRTRETIHLNYICSLSSRVSLALIYECVVGSDGGPLLSSLLFQ